MNAQVNIPPDLSNDDLSEINEAIQLLKKEKLHIILPRKNSDTNEIYKKVFTDYWKFSQLDFVNDDGAKNIKNPIGFYFGLGSVDIKTTWTTHYSAGEISTFNFNNTYIFYQLYNIYSHTYKNTTDTLIQKLALYDLYTDFPTLVQPFKLTDENFSFGGKARNWSPGFLKNYLQFIQMNFEHPENYKINTKISIQGKHPMLKNLKTDTLFIPEYVFIRFNYMTGNESKRVSLKSLFKNYDFPYAVISMDKLSDKILHATKPVYYLHYAKSSASTGSCIIDGNSGDILFSVSDHYYSYNLKQKEVKRMSDLIKKSK